MASSLFLSLAGAVTAGRSLAFSASSAPSQIKHVSLHPVRINRTKKGRKSVEIMYPVTETRQRGFSFSAAGLLFPYYIGVAQLLIERGYIKETTAVGGCSAGAIVSVAIASGISMENLRKATITLAHDCRLHGTIFRLGASLRETLNHLLPEDVHMRITGRVRVGITQIGDNMMPNGLLIDKFRSKEDVINALLASCFIPGYSGPMPATMFRNHLCIDGAFAYFIPPTSATQTIGVCAFPGMGVLQEIGISPDSSPAGRHNANILQYVNWALGPAANEVLDKLFESGYLDASVWAQRNH